MSCDIRDSGAMMKRPRPIARHSEETSHFTPLYPILLSLKLMTKRFPNIKPVFIRSSFSIIISQMKGTSPLPFHFPRRLPQDKLPCWLASTTALSPSAIIKYLPTLKTRLRGSVETDEDATSLSHTQPLPSPLHPRSLIS